MSDEMHEAGMHCWLDLATTDLSAATTFYSALLGWEFREVPMPDASGGTYTMAVVDGGDLGGLREFDEAERAQGMPPHWLLYTAVDDVDATAAKAAELGGQAVVPPFDIPGTGRMAVIMGPTGEMFGVWLRSSAHKGCAPYEGKNGAFCWGELGTHDVDRSGGFYVQVFGYDAETQDMGPMKYTVFNAGGKAAAGMYLMPPEMAEVPSHWLAYFRVADIDASLARAQELGGAQVCPATEAPGVGRFAILGDPQGAHFALLQPADQG